MKSLVSVIRLAAVSAIVMYANPVVAANVERSCDAHYLIHMAGVNNERGMHVFTIADVMGMGKDGAFSARRGCGQLVPNRCRRRASEAALQCMRAHGQNPARAPAECRSNGVRDYKVDNLEQLAKTQVCEYLRSSGKVVFGLLPPDYSVTITIQGKVFGDTGCGGGDRRDVKVELVKNLKVKCR